MDGNSFLSIDADYLSKLTTDQYQKIVSSSITNNLNTNNSSDSLQITPG